MNNRKLGTVLLGLGLSAGTIFFLLQRQLSRTNALLCTPTAECLSLNSYLTLTNIAIGIFVAILSLGFYLIFFEKGYEAILRRLEAEKNNMLKEDKWKIIMGLLDENERKVLEAIKGQEGITQTTLRLRTDLSKAAISSIVTEFEKKKLIAREKKGKTYSIYISEAI
ncbi:MarR family transcriptional regulator [Candidatus Woesearchaeota archaeon]|nr:MarR family transcriptional regulator [Candidatus Woesearchaeota archaeon]